VIVKAQLIIIEMIEIFGINAGKVWTILDQQGKQNIKELKKTAKLTDKNLYAALGWLSREGKIKIADEGKDIFVSLI
ncbi:MAG TPA: winged helix-turn-helix domain-containing protein, partial [Marinilabiliaceae bacterium]|nr:winged helix-turn-helix domain-containing protein [Marinilabiliaceae bacterium]